MLSTRQFPITWTIVFLPIWRLFGNRGMLHGVVSNLDIYVFIDNGKTFLYLLKTSCPQRALIDDNLTQRLRRTGNYFRTGCAVTHLSRKQSTYTHSAVFSVHWTDRQHMEEMETTGLEPVTCRLWADRSASWTKFPERRLLLQFKSNYLRCCDSCPLSRNKGSAAPQNAETIRDVWSPFIHPLMG